MIELFRQAEAGRLKLDDTLVVRNEFRSIVDGSPYKLSEGDDSDREVYANVGKPMTLRALNEAMITVSSNFATNILIDRLGAENVRATVTEARRRGHARAPRRRRSEGVRQRAEQRHHGARRCWCCSRSSARGEAVSAAADAEMIAVLEAAEVQGRHSRRGARRDAGRAQNRHHHPHPPRRRHRLRPAAVRAGRPRARHPGSEGQRPADRPHLACRRGSTSESARRQD